MYELYLDAVSTLGKIALSQNSQILFEESFSLAWNESSLLSQKVFHFLDTQSIQLTDIDNIYVVSGPWSFTGIRSICLFVNTLAYIYPHLYLTPISFFDLYDTYPIIKQSSRRDAFVKKQKNTIIEILQISELEQLLRLYRKSYGSFDLSLLDSEWIIIESSYNTSQIIQSLIPKKLKFIEPLYIKKPNIS